MDRFVERTTFAASTLAAWFESPETRKAAVLHLKSSARVLTAALAVIYLSLACSTFFIQSQPDSWIPATNPNFHVDTSTGRVKDRHGRERVFHGVNVVFKSNPWLPQTESFHPQLSFSTEDVQILQKLGLNAVRLGVMWPGVHPEQPGTANHTYLGEIKRIVQELHAAGIYTLVDFHQDVFGSRFCGEGVPDWLVDNAPFSANTNMGSSLPQASSDSKQASPTAGLRGQGTSEGSRNSTGLSQGMKDVPCVGYAVCMTPEEYSESFPEPLLPRFGLRLASETSEPGAVVASPGIPVIPGGVQSHLQMKLQVKASLNAKSPPSLAQCESLDWGVYHLTFAVSRAFQDLYENRWGWRDRLAEYWRDVAVALKGEDGVLGYDLMNEPWAGDVFFNPLLFAPGVADRLNFAPLYEHLQSAIRKVDPNHLVFFEGLTFDDLASGFTQVPGGQVYANMSLISYHYYRPPNVAPKATFKQKDQESKRLQCGWMLTEFGIPNRRPDWLNSAGNALSGAGWLSQVNGQLKPGVACLPVEEEEKQQKAGTSSCSDGRNARNRCAGASARSWKEFVQHWSQETNSSRLHDSLSAALPPCDDGRRSGLAQRGSPKQGGSALKQVQEARASAKDSRDEGIHPRTLREKETFSQHSIIRPEVVVLQRRSTRPVPKALQQLSDGFTPPLASRKDLELELSSQADRPGVGLGDRKVTPGSWNELAETLDLADEHQQSWMAWEYKPFVPITGANYGLFQPDGTLHPIVVQFFRRTYPLAVAGTTETYTFDPYSSTFTMAYTASRVAEEQLKKSWKDSVLSVWRSVGGKLGLGEGLHSPAREALSPLAATTEIFVCCSRAMRVRVEPAGVEQEWDAERSLLRLRHSGKHSGMRVSVLVEPV